MKREEMNLPEGKTCDDCFHFEKCVGIGYTWSRRKECDFYPSRFRQRSTSLAQLLPPQSESQQT